MEPLRLSTCVVDLRALQVVRDDGSRTALSAREAQLLEVLARRPGQAVDRETLNRDVLRYRSDVVSRALDAMVYRLRTKIEADPARPDHLLTAHGEGYRLELGQPADRPTEPEVPALAAVARDPAVPAGPTTLGWADAVLGAVASAGGALIDREGDAFVAAFRSAARAASFCVAVVDAGAPIGARGAACTGADDRLVRRLLAAAAAGRVLFTERLHGEVRAAAEIRDRRWAPLGAVRLAAGEPSERLVEAGGDGRPSLPDADGNLVAPVTPLFGRDADLERAWARLHGAELERARLVTLTGTGGVGKTRLATELGQRWRVNGAGAWFCDLSACRTDADVSAAVARSLGVPLGPGGDPGGALNALDGDLVVFDNAEQAIPAVRAAVQRWTASERGARVLVTSRERLGAVGEQVIELSPLPIDDGVALFRRRAADLGAAVPDSEALRALVARLDGLPLAIELAAARTEILTPDALLARLDDRLAALGSDASRVPRHVDLTAMVGWSWELCTEAEQALLVATGPFVGGFTVEDAEAVGGTDALAALHALRRKGLVRPTDGGRLACYAAVRAFVLGVADLDPARDQHARWLARWGDPGLRDRLEGPDGSVVLAELVGCVPDLLAAFDHALPEDPELAVRAFFGAAAALRRVGPTTAIEPLAQRVLPYGVETVRVNQARAVFGAPASVLREVDAALASDDSPRIAVSRLRVAHLLGEVDRFEAACPEVLARARASGDGLCLADALSWATVHEGRLRPRGPAMLAHVRETIALCQRLGNRAGEAQAHRELGWAAQAVDDRVSALDEAERALALAVDSYEAWSRLEGLILLGEVRRARAEPAATFAALAQADALATRLGDAGARAVVLGNLGLSHAVFTDVAVARPLCEQVLELHRAHGLPRTEALALTNLGVVDLAVGRFEAALGAFDSAMGLFERFHGLKYLALALPSRARARLELGDPHGALADADRAIGVARGLGAHQVEAAALGQRALIQARLGDRAGAADDVASAEEALARVVGPGAEAAEQLIVRAEVALALGDLGVAAVALADARTELDALGIPAATVYGAQCARIGAALGE